MYFESLLRRSVFMGQLVSALRLMSSLARGNFKARREGLSHENDLYLRKR